MVLISVRTLFDIQLTPGNKQSLDTFLYAFKHDRRSSFQLAQKLGILYSEMIFVNGFVHCDPHPGNILVRRSPKHEVEIVFLDHGLYQVR